jgi:hypothetical protein
MTDRINKRWIVVGIIWAVALTINVWNIREMHGIQEARERHVLLKMDEQFLQAHSQDISESRKKRKTFYHSAEALNLGLLTVENELGALVERYELAGVSVKSRPDQAQGGSVPILLSCRGSLKKVVQCLQTLRRDVAYMPVTQVKIDIGDSGALATCKIRLNYRFKIVGPETPI